jgi:hypothetical protein
MVGSSDAHDLRSIGGGVEFFRAASRPARAEPVEDLLTKRPRIAWRETLRQAQGDRDWDWIFLRYASRLPFGRSLSKTCSRTGSGGMARDPSTGSGRSGVVLDFPAQSFPPPVRAKLVEGLLANRQRGRGTRPFDKLRAIGGEVGFPRGTLPAPLGLSLSKTCSRTGSGGVARTLRQAQGDFVHRGCQSLLRTRGNNDEPIDPGKTKPQHRTTGRGNGRRTKKHLPAIRSAVKSRRRSC